MGSIKQYQVFDLVSLLVSHTLLGVICKIKSIGWGRSAKSIQLKQPIPTSPAGLVRDCFIMKRAHIVVYFLIDYFKIIVDQFNITNIYASAH